MPSIAFVSALPLGHSTANPARPAALRRPSGPSRLSSRRPAIPSRVVAKAQPSSTFEDFESALNELASSTAIPQHALPRNAQQLSIPEPDVGDEKPRRRSATKTQPAPVDDVWTDEHHALYSVLMDNHYLSHDESLRTKLSPSDAPDPADPAFLSSDPPPATVSASRSLQSNPRLSNTDQLRAALSSIQRRRSKLATERAEDAVNPLLAEFESDLQTDLPADFVSDDDDASDGDSMPFEQFVDDLRRRHASSVIPDSINSAIIVPPSLQSDPPTQLIASLRPHAKLTTRAPMLQRPLLEAHDGVLDALYPPCVRCSSPTRQDTSEQYGLCDNCYTSIHLTSPFGISRDAVPDNDPFRKDERLAHEAEQTAKATAVAATIRSPFAAAASGADATVQASAGSTAADKPQAAESAGKAATKAPTGNGGPASAPPQSPNAVQDDISGDGWSVRAADRALRTINPIRNLVQGITVKPTPDKELIRLSVGDPTVYGNLVVSKRVTERMCSVLRGGGVNGYTLSMGSVEGREAVARRYSTDDAPLGKDDVFLTSGASGAIELALGVLANEGDNILLPKPGFPLFRTLAENLGIECRYYRLSAETGWQADLGDLTALSDDRTRAIVVNNPSNPCGSVWPRAHMDQLLAVASELRLPILSDVVYAYMVFGDAQFHSFGSVSEDVPVLAVGAISKQLVVPGWRLGWLLVHDRGDVLARGAVRQGLRQLTTRMLMPNSIAQSALDEMLRDADGFKTVMGELEANARFTLDNLRDVPGLRCIAPQGAMYMMVEVDVQGMGLRDDMEFVERLLEEEAVFVLPGQCFEMANYVRVVFAAPKEILSEAVLRMKSFCSRHMRK